MCQKLGAAMAIAAININITFTFIKVDHPQIWTCNKWKNHNRQRSRLWTPSALPILPLISFLISLILLNTTVPSPDPCLLFLYGVEVLCVSFHDLSLPFHFVTCAPLFKLKVTRSTSHSRPGCRLNTLRKPRHFKALLQMATLQMALLQYLIVSLYALGDHAGQLVVVFSTVPFLHLFQPQSNQSNIIFLSCPVLSSLSSFFPELSTNRPGSPAASVSTWHKTWHNLHSPGPVTTQYSN